MILLLPGQGFFNSLTRTDVNSWKSELLGHTLRTHFWMIDLDLQTCLIIGHFQFEHLPEVIFFAVSKSKIMLGS